MRNPLRLVATAGLLLFMALGLGVSALPAGAVTQGGGHHGNSQEQGNQGQGNEELSQGARSQENCQNGQFQKGEFQQQKGDFQQQSQEKKGEFQQQKGEFQNAQGDENAQGDQGNSDWSKAQGQGQEGQGQQGEGEHGQAQGCGQITVIKHVASRHNASDSFDIFVAGNDRKEVLGQASTGTGNSATAGPITVHPGSYVLGERATSGTGTNLAQYKSSWSCTDNNGSVKMTSFKDGTVKVNDKFGEDIVCTVTNQMPPVSVPFATPEAGMGLAGVAGLLGLGWVIVRRRRRLAA